MPHVLRSISPAAGTLLLGLFATHAGVATAAEEDTITLSPPSLVSALDADGWSKAQAEPLPDPDKWNWQVLSDRHLPQGSPGAVLRPRPIGSAPESSFASRTDHQDGSAAVTVGRRLPTEWETKVGVDLGLAADPATNYRIASPSAASDTAGSGAAWANLKIPGFNAPLSWDQAQIDARIDPTNEEGRLGTRFSRSLAIGDRLSLTLQNGYAVTQSLPTVAPTSSEIWSTDHSVRVTLPDSGTSFSAGESLSSLDDKWLRSLSAEQKMFGGPVSLTGTASETITGEIAKSVTARFRQTW